MGSVLASLLIVVTAAPAVGAAEAVVGWADCVAEARRANPALHQAELQLRASRARRNSAYGGFLPRVSASLGASDSDEDARLWFRDMNASWSARLSASQSLFSGFSTVADVLRASASVRREEAQLRQASADLRSRLRLAFVTVVYGQENVTVQDGIARRRRANAELVRLKYEAGRENKGAALRAEADARQADFEVSRARRALILARQKLARELGRDAFTTFRVEGDWTLQPPPPEPDLAALAAATPTAGSVRASADEARASLMSARAPFYPSLDASASVGRSGPGFPPDEEKTWSAGLSVSWNLFNGGRDWFGWRAAAAAATESESVLAATVRDQRVALQEALFSYVDAHEAISVREQYFEAARARAEIGRAQYANGLLGFVQWDLIEGELVDAERSALAARRDGQNAEAGWRRALGEGL